MRIRPEHSRPARLPTAKNRNEPTINDPHGGADVRPHPAKFSDVLLEHIKTIIPDGTEWIYDPMAGVGKVTRLGPQYKYHCNELEPEWANQIEGANIVTVEDAKVVAMPPNALVITSPPYGNRMADCFVTDNDRSMQGRYAGDLGRRVSDGSTACLHYGPMYKAMITAIYRSIFSRMRQGDRFILNVSNFIKGGVEQNVIGFYLSLFSSYGFALEICTPIITPRDRGRGANSDARVEHEVVMRWKKI